MTLEPRVEVLVSYEYLQHVGDGLNGKNVMREGSVRVYVNPQTMSADILTQVRAYFERTHELFRCWIHYRSSAVSFVEMPTSQRTEIQEIVRDHYKKARRPDDLHTGNES